MIKIKVKDTIYFAGPSSEEEALLYHHINEDNITHVYELKDRVVINFTDGSNVTISEKGCAHSEEYSKLLQKLGRRI